MTPAELAAEVDRLVEAFARSEGVVESRAWGYIQSHAHGRYLVAAAEEADG